jgi:hypothetical protein
VRGNAPDNQSAPDISIAPNKANHQNALNKIEAPMNKPIVYPIAVEPFKIGFMDQKGTVVVEPIYDGVSFPGIATNPSYPNLANVHSCEIMITKENLNGFVNAKGELIVKPVLKNTGHFVEDLACAENDNEKWGFIDKQGEWVIDPRFDKYHYFKEGWASVSCDGKSGFINRSGEWVIPPTFDYAGIFSNDLALVKRGERRGFINRKGIVVIPMVYDLASEFSEGVAAVEKNEKYGYIDSTGKTVIKHQFSSAGKFSEGMAPVAIDGDYGYINLKGEWAIKPQFHEANSFHNGFANVSKGSGKNGIINQSGEFIIPPRFTDLHNWFYEELIYGDDRAGKRGYFDTKGNLKIKLSAKEKGYGGPFYFGLAALLDEKTGLINYIDHDGNYVWKPLKTSDDIPKRNRGHYSKISKT